jgi:hypothetical protein
VEQKKFHEPRFSVCSENLLEAIDPKRSLVLKSRRRKTAISVCERFVLLPTSVTRSRLLLHTCLNFPRDHHSLIYIENQGGYSCRNYTIMKNHHIGARSWATGRDSEGVKEA